MATAALQEVLPVEHGKSPDDQNNFGAQHVQNLCQALGMDPAPTNELQKPDLNFLLVWAS